MNTCFGYSELELSWPGASNIHPQCMFHGEVRTVLSFSGGTSPYLELYVHVSYVDKGNGKCYKKS